MHDRRIEISESTIYPLLRRLKHLGYCETYLKESHEGPPRPKTATTRRTWRMAQKRAV